MSNQLFTVSGTRIIYRGYQRPFQDKTPGVVLSEMNKNTEKLIWQQSGQRTDSSSSSKDQCKAADPGSICTFCVRGDGRFCRRSGGTVEVTGSARYGGLTCFKLRALRWFWQDTGNEVHWRMSKHHYIPTLKKKRNLLPRGFAARPGTCEIIETRFRRARNIRGGEEDGTGTIFVRGRT